MQPIMIAVDGPLQEQCQNYRVRFIGDGAEVEHIFTVTESDITCVSSDDEFSIATIRDPIAPKLYQAVLKFHEARKA